MMNPLVAFDESGNTGQDLLNPAQPVFSLASVHLSDSEMDYAIKVISPQLVQDVKFKNLRRSRSGRQRVISLLRSQYVDPNNVKINVIHKSYMITCKIVDLLIEPLTYRDGIDLYERGANIALANLHHASMPVVFGKTDFTSLQRRFVRMLRYRDYASVREFYELCWILYNSCKYSFYKAPMAPILASEKIVHKVLEATDANLLLDPAIPSFVDHCAAWGSYFDREFDLVHDESKAIEHERELLLFLMAKDEPEVEVGYDCRKAVFPLKATGISFGDSKIVRQLQVADIIAGASAYWGAGLAGANVDRDFWKDLDACGLRDLIINVIWPSPDVTPEELGTEEVGGTNLVDYITGLVARQEGKKHSISNISSTVL